MGHDGPADDGNLKDKLQDTMKKTSRKKEAYSTFRLFKRGTAKQPDDGPKVANKFREEEESSGVTVDELHNALASVNVDVLERHPDIHKRPSGPAVQDKRKEAEGPDHYALTWNPGASLSVFEDYAKTWGSLSINKKQRPDIERRQPDEELWEGMEKERDEYRDASDYAEKERQLQNTYAMMQEEILTMKVMLKEVEAADSALPMLADEPDADSAVGESAAIPSDDQTITAEQMALLGEQPSRNGAGELDLLAVLEQEEILEVDPLAVQSDRNV